MVELAERISFSDGMPLSSSVERHLIGQVGIVKSVVQRAKGFGQLGNPQPGQEIMDDAVGASI